MSQEFAVNVHEVPPQVDNAVTWDLLDSLFDCDSEWIPSPSEPMVCDQASSPAASDDSGADFCKAKVVRPVRRASPKAASKKAASPKTVTPARKPLKDRKMHVLKADNVVHWLTKLVSPVACDFMAKFDNSFVLKSLREVNINSLR